MTFKEVLHEVVSRIEQDGSVSYRAIKRQFDDVDDEYLEDLKDAIVYAHPVELEKRGLGRQNQQPQNRKASQRLVWTRGPSPPG